MFVIRVGQLKALARFDETHSTRSRHEFGPAASLLGDRDAGVFSNLGQD